MKFTTTEHDAAVSIVSLMANVEKHALVADFCYSRQVNQTMVKMLVSEYMDKALDNIKKETDHEKTS